MEIPITISVSQNTREFVENLFGLGDKDSVSINENIVLGKPTHPPLQIATASVQPEQWVDWNLALFIADKALGFGLNGFAIADWLWNNIKAKKFQIKFDGKKIADKDAFQKTLDEYLKSKQDNQ